MASHFAQAVRAFARAAQARAMARGGIWISRRVTHRHLASELALSTGIGAKVQRERVCMAEPTPFHDRDGVIWLDGKLVPWRDAKIHVLTHALHYGSAVFEGLRAYGGAIFKLSEHSQRLI